MTARQAAACGHTLQNAKGKLNALINNGNHSTK
jgi:hypothetical protein